MARFPGFALSGGSSIGSFKDARKRYSATSGLLLVFMPVVLTSSLHCLAPWARAQEADSAVPDSSLAPPPVDSPTQAAGSGDGVSVPPGAEPTENAEESPVEQPAASVPAVAALAGASRLDTPEFTTQQIGITLKDAFERMRRQNRDIKKAELDLRMAEIDYETAFSSMFLPNFTIGVSNSLSPYTAGQYTSEAGEAATRADYGRGLVTSTAFDLTLFKYNLFNGWADWSTWQDAKVTWQESKFTFEDALRTKRKEVFKQFYSLKVSLEKLSSAESSLLLAEAIRALRVAEQSVGKSTEEDLSSAETDLSTAKNAVLEQQQAVREGALAMNQLLGDPIGTQYNIKAKIPELVTVGLNADQAFRIFSENSPIMRNLHKSLRGAEVGLLEAERSRIPTATVDFSGLKVTASNGPFGATPPVIATDASNGVNWDVSLALTVSIPLYNQDGFLNSRKVEKARLGLEKQQMDFADTVMENRKKVLTDLGNLKQKEQELTNKKKAADEAQTVFQKLYQRKDTSTVSRLEFRDAINLARESSVAYLEAQQDYINEKIEFANFLGLEHLPGDPIR
jgi:outer membrane protein